MKSHHIQVVLKCALVLRKRQFTKLDHDYNNHYLRHCQLQIVSNVEIKKKQIRELTAIVIGGRCTTYWNSLKMKGKYCVVVQQFVLI